MTEWEPVIGLEIHVHLKTRTKMFCACEVVYSDPPNSHTCPVCLAHPGALPVPNLLAIEHTVKLGLALGCEIAPRALFHRKNYFYPDNPKGYQISQYDVPLCASGAFVVPKPDGDREVGITRAHLEEDAAKNVHVGGVGGRIGGSAHTNVDFNRGGTPLLEIVTEPDLRSADDAKRFLQLLRQTIVELGISDAEMEKGTLRADANVSVRKRGETELPHAHGAEEHELVQLHRARDGGGDRAADRRLGVGRRGRAADVRLRRRDGEADAAPFEGGGRGLPLLPRAGPRPGRAGRRARRARTRRRLGAARHAACAGSRPSSTSTSPRGS